MLGVLCTLCTLWVLHTVGAVHTVHTVGAVHAVGAVHTVGAVLGPHVQLRQQGHSPATHSRSLQRGGHHHSRPWPWDLAEGHSWEGTGLKALQPHALPWAQLLCPVPRPGGEQRAVLLPVLSQLRAGPAALGVPSVRPEPTGNTAPAGQPLLAWVQKGPKLLPTHSAALGQGCFILWGYG